MTDIPLSYAQESMWLTDRMHGPAAVSAPTVCARVRGDLDLAALRGAVADVVARHDSLRTVFAEAGGELVQRVLARAPVDFGLVDLPGADGETCAEECAREVLRGFHLSTGPLLRTRVYRLGDRDHVVLCVRHHIIGDGRSDEVFAADIATAYRHRVDPAAPALPALGLQYPAFARWQRDRLRGDHLDRLLGHWRRALAGAPRRIGWGPEPATAGRERRGRSLVLPLAAGAGAELDAVARAVQVSPFMLMLAAFRVALARATGATDAVVATPVESRVRPEVRDLIGCFLNTLLIPGTVPAWGSARDLFEAERARTLAAFAHQELPYQVLARDAVAQVPPIQVMFSYQVGDQPVPALAGLDVTPLDLGRVGAQFDLMVKAVRNGDALALQLAYDDRVLDEPRVRRLGEWCEVALRRALADPDTPVGRLLDGVAGEAVDGSGNEVVVLFWSTGEPDDAPEGVAAEFVAAAWAQVLGSDPPGVSVRLLDCGGHSLTVTKLAFLLRDLLGLEITVADLFAYETVAAQVDLVAARLAARLAPVGEEFAHRILDEI